MVDLVELVLGTGTIISGALVYLSVKENIKPPEEDNPDNVTLWADEPSLSHQQLRQPKSPPCRHVEDYHTLDQLD